MTYKTRTAPTTPLKQKRPAPRVAAKLVANIQLSADIPCFIDIVESVSLAPGKRLTYNIRWNGGDSMANEFAVDWYVNPNWEALGISPLASSEILPRVTFMPGHPFPRSTETWTGTITFDVPLNIKHTQLFAVLRLAKT